ncbi:acyl carrier protein [Paracoccus litorisediminis]|jgi:acyl carrier protein|uniref:Acyl carrier protein n=1 Tax=Paracoccus litorisediminis TaxID=2006130 RepID=A0A844HQ97_9RHOB|nr:phosphopantetheine-binding protein [Paracoccus litorisediminis]MTH59861.1 acyl carrier protein [Paracoccus litorisediminis]
MSLTQSQLITYLRDEQNIGEAIDNDTELFSSGILDSVSMVGLITYIEETTGTIIQPGDVTLENFDTANRIAAFVASLA